MAHALLISKSQPDLPVDDAMQGGIGMNFLIYSAPDSVPGSRLLSRLTVCEDPPSWEAVASLARLRQRLCSPMVGDQALILVPRDETELSQMIHLKALLRTLRLILVLPNAAHQTISQGHTLGARFLSYADGNLWDVVAVMHKMSGRPYRQPAEELNV